jgi:hypothetical protein
MTLPAEDNSQAKLPSSAETTTPSNPDPQETIKEFVQRCNAAAEAELRVPPAELGDQFSYARELLEENGYNVTWDITSYYFRDAVRANDASALERLDNEISAALERLGDKFVDCMGDTLVNGTDLATQVCEALLELIQEEAENDAKLKAEEEAENDAKLKAEEEAAGDVFPKAFARARRKREAKERRARDRRRRNDPKLDELVSQIRFQWVSSEILGETELAEYVGEEEAEEYVQDFLDDREPGDRRYWPINPKNKSSNNDPQLSEGR